ncbi:hypothetical protein PRIPAC_72067 [Pristionchus pacificus]|uniref:Uncharacterized protein n=1 Tax=Pristionchus pacificus TaxID=54126 RepID=A0A2A6C8F6_PRIPA|nr:hypothetical protein PRIPAC_72067 [Pristionchus pacificus]|eukprot:PDM74358.1 hypothetical protein PRIPAC_41714 [Pristionchus pacificus]
MMETDVGVGIGSYLRFNHALSFKLGGVIPTVNIKTMRFFRYITKFDIFESSNSYSFDNVVRTETYYDYCTYLLFIFAFFKTFKYIGSIINGLAAKAKRSALVSVICIMFLISYLHFGYILFTYLVVNHRADYSK